jgi:hypothetical protein
VPCDSCNYYRERFPSGVLPVSFTQPSTNVRFHNTGDWLPFLKMSRTQTAQEPTTVSETLRIYDVYETGREETSEPPLNRAQNGVEQAQSTTQPNENWPSDWRRVPPYRESSRTHRVSDRAAGRDVAEAAIVVTMFHGVWIMGVRYERALTDLA